MIRCVLSICVFVVVVVKRTLLLRMTFNLWLYALSVLKFRNIKRVEVDLSVVLCECVVVVIIIIIIIKFWGDLCVCVISHPHAIFVWVSLNR